MLLLSRVGLRKKRNDSKPSSVQPIAVWIEMRRDSRWERKNACYPLKRESRYSVRWGRLRSTLERIKPIIELSASRTVQSSVGLLGVTLKCNFRRKELCR